MQRAWRLLAIFYRTSVQTDVEYRADFFTRVIASLLGLVGTLGGLWVAFQYTSQIKGWSFAQVLVLLAVYHVMNGLIEMFIAPNMREIMKQVRDGTLDFVLLKPVSSQFMATFRTVNIWQSSSLLIGIGIATFALRKLSVAVGWHQAGMFALTLLAGLAIVYSFWLVLVTLTFWFVRLENIEQIVWQAFEAGRYPVEIYPNWLRMTLTYVVPIAFIITVPGQALSGRLPDSFVWTSLLVGLGALIASSAFWRFGLRSYTGASS